MEDPVVPLERILDGHPLAGLLWERQIEKVLLKHGGKSSKLVMLICQPRTGIFLSVHVDDIKLVRTKQHINPTWKVLMKDVDLEEATSFLDHVDLGCTQREGQISKDIVDNYKICLNPEFLLVPWKSYQSSRET